MASAEALLTGFTTRILSYDRVEGVLLRPADAVVRYGTIVEVEDRASRQRFLAMIVDVKEETPHPALDVERLRGLMEELLARHASLEDAVKVLEEVLSPSQELVKWSSIMTVDLAVAGVVAERGGVEVLDAYERPPRPFSRLSYPDPAWLEAVLHGRLGPRYRETGLYIGRLSYNPSVRVYLNPGRLTTHLSILGQTGAGKTETVKRLVFEVARRRNAISYPKGGTVVFDVAGEYTGYPYLRPEVVALLDAVANPQAYSPEPPHDEPARYTILIPYDPAVGEAQKDRLLQGMLDIACTIAERLGRPVDILVYTATERRKARLAPGCRASPASLLKAKYNDAYKLILDSDFLVLGLPHPGFMDVDTMVELSGTKSEYFPLIVSEAAGALDLYDGDEVYGLDLLRGIAVAGASESLGQLAPPGPRSLPPVLNELDNYCKGGDPDAWDRFVLRANNTMGIGAAFALQRYLAWLAYRLGKSSPLVESEQQAACKLLRDPDGRRAITENFRNLTAALRSIEAPKSSYLSAVRALTKLSRMSSSIVDPIVFNAVMDRLMEGFTIVHLAPPSMGDTDHTVSLIVKKLFDRHVGRFDPERLTVLVVEEAHNLAPAGVEKASKRALLRVAREGRKWGLSLWLVSQRPAFIDASILSQAATSILLRTTNPDDISTIKRGVESVASDVAERLPDLEPSRGEALLTGLAAPERRVPLLVSVEMLKRRASQASKGATT